MRFALPLVLLAALAAAEGPVVEDKHVAEALATAGANRAELEKVLAHFARSADPRRLAAARFLVANMPGHGYVLTELRTEDGKRIDYDPLAYPDFKQALAALDALGKEHGELEFARDRMVPDVETIESAFLIAHVERSFAAWEGVPPRWRVGFETFLHHVLPYRGSQEPIDDWLAPLRERYADAWTRLGDDADPSAVAAWIGKDQGSRVRFNERYYLHPTDQGFAEMERSAQGRCEDLTNYRTYAMRSVAIATAADYTPYWAHRDNNHAWNVMLDADGRGFAKANAHAAKVYRKTYAIQRDALCFRLPEGREAPNRFMADRFSVDVTDQYRETTDVVVALDTAVVGPERFAYLCVFNGGEWRAIHWAPIEEGRATFDRMGRDIVYLPAVHDGEKLVAAAPPLVVERNGLAHMLAGTGGTASVYATAVHPRKVSPDTGAVTTVSHLEEGTTYVLKRWVPGHIAEVGFIHVPGGWKDVAEATAGAEALRFDGLPSDGLYWLVAKESRRLERVFTIEHGRQRFW